MPKKLKPTQKSVAKRNTPSSNKSGKKGNLFLLTKTKILTFDAWFVALCNKVFIRKNLQTFLGTIFVVAGFLLLYKVPTIKLESNRQNKEPIVASRQFDKNKKSLSVVRILLPDEHIDLRVTPAKLIDGYWQTTENGASQGEGTANPGTGGNVVIFAHAREGMFYNLKDVKKDEIIYVFTKDRWFRYKVSDIRTVYPKDVATVAPTKREELTLFTCSGFFDEKRLIVKASPIN